MVNSAFVNGAFFVVVSSLCLLRSAFVSSHFVDAGAAEHHAQLKSPSGLDAHAWKLLAGLGRKLV